MINRIIEFSARNRFLVFTLVGAAALAGYWSMEHVSLDALPDLSDTQVIVYSRWDRSPDILEAQVTYPIVSALVGAPRVKAVRGFSDFGYSFVYVVFQDGTDIYCARARSNTSPASCRGSPKASRQSSVRMPRGSAGSFNTFWRITPANIRLPIF